jgi:hypothetical protein
MVRAMGHDSVTGEPMEKSQAQGPNVVPWPGDRRRWRSEGPAEGTPCSRPAVTLSWSPLPR